MSALVVDASVALKWLIDEELSEQAVRLLDGRHMLYAPELLYAESANALWTMRKRGVIDSVGYREAISLLQSAPLSVPAAMRELCASASRLATDLDHPVYDCYYLAMAMQEHAMVVTADRRFYSKASAHPYLSNHINSLESFENQH